jgi:CDP-paratose 2-epimerase
MTILITGCAGFIGSNLAKRLLDKGHEVIGFGWCEKLKPYPSFLEHPHFTFISGDIRNESDYRFSDIDAIFHLAANTGITKGLKNPYGDFEINTISTVKLLEWARTHGKPLFVYPSSNKVYPLDNTSRTPYGASKHSSEIWCMEYGHTFAVPAVVLRQSCIYGPHQYGYMEQGWISWFMRANVKGLPIQVFGDGEQQRDILYIDDLIDLYELLLTHRDLWGNIYDVGGGEKNVVSVNAIIHYIEQNNKPFVQIDYAGERTSDQKTYVTNLISLQDIWYPQINTEEGLKKTFDWVKENNEI